jgi:hypothetical protein
MATPGAKFDQADYDAVHIPLVKEAFTPTGLKAVQVLKGLPGPDGGLGGPRASEVLGDVARFHRHQADHPGQRGGVG